MAYPCNNYDFLFLNAYTTFQAAKGNGDYENDESTDLIDIVRFHNDLDDSFNSDLEVLYNYSMEFSDAIPGITKKQSALLDGYSGLIEAPDKILTLLSHNKAKFKDEELLKQACYHIKIGRGIVLNFTKDIYECMADLRDTKIPEGKPTFEMIYKRLHKYLQKFGTDVQDVDGVVNENIRDSVHQFLETELKPVINDAGLTEPLTTYYQCNQNKRNEVSVKLFDLLKDLEPLFHTQEVSSPIVTIPSVIESIPTSAPLNIITPISAPTLPSTVTLTQPSLFTTSEKTAHEYLLTPTLPTKDSAVPKSNETVLQPTVSTETISELNVASPTSTETLSSPTISTDTGKEENKAMPVTINNESGPGIVDTTHIVESVQNNEAAVNV